MARGAAHPMLLKVPGGWPVPKYRGRPSARLLGIPPGGRAAYRRDSSDGRHRPGALLRVQRTGREIRPVLCIGLYRYGAGSGDAALWSARVLAGRLGVRLALHSVIRQIFTPFPTATSLKAHRGAPGTGNQWGHWTECARALGWGDATSGDTSVACPRQLPRAGVGRWRWMTRRWPARSLALCRGVADIVQRRHGVPRGLPAHFTHLAARLNK